MFAGWNKDTPWTNEVQYTDCQEVSFSQNTKLYAIWKEPDFNVVYKLPNETVVNWRDFEGGTIPSKFFSPLNPSGNPLPEMVKIYNGVTTIAEQSFYDCTTLKKVAMARCVTTIGKMAFMGCGKLTEMTIPSSVTSIGQNAFGSTLIRTLTFDGMDKATVQALPNYGNWGLGSGCKLKCTDGDLTV